MGGKKKKTIVDYKTERIEADKKEAEKHSRAKYRGVKPPKPKPTPKPKPKPKAPKKPTPTPTPGPKKEKKVKSAAAQQTERAIEAMKKKLAKQEKVTVQVPKKNPIASMSVGVRKKRKKGTE